ncbi:MAG: hypothetical protein KC910_35240, partial [Candidatus Eremiobacteraeota bacterium]|nr:hypothetical protein [Candidatus Eremiobacteraeota bacterium]
MTQPGEDDLVRNLDTQSRRLADVESAIEALLNDEGTQFEAPINSPSATAYEELTRANDLLRQQRTWSEVDFDAALTPPIRARLESWESRQRLRWGRSDFVVVGLAGLTGSLACIFDDQIDALARSAMGWLKSTDLVRGWELDARGMPIDYTGPKFGGPGHRMRSAGHDMGRPFAALQQIRTGVFEGVYWEDGARHVFNTAPGAYEPVSALGPALVLWLKHLLADVVTPMSLPLPGFTHLYELPVRELRVAAHQMYDGKEWGTGYNVRNALVTPTLMVMLVDVVVRVH